MQPGGCEMTRRGWAAAIALALAMAAGTAAAEIDVAATQAALAEVRRIRNEAHASGGYVVTHQVNGQSVYTIVSQQSLENQITLAIMNGEMSVDEAPGLVRAMRALNSNSMENLSSSESALSSMLIEANEDADYWARIDAGGRRDRYDSEPVGPSRPRPHADRGYRLSDGPTYRPERGSRRSGGSSSGYSSSGRSAFSSAVDSAGRDSRAGRGKDRKGKGFDRRMASGSSYPSSSAAVGKDRRDKGADRRMSSGSSYPSAPAADDRRRKKRRDKPS